MRKAFVILSAAACLASGLATAQSTNGVAVRLQAGKHQTIVGFGTSLTAGGIWIKQLQGILDQRYPGLVTIVNSGGSGMWSQWGLDNLEERVIRQKPGVVIIEFAVNDSVARFHCTVQQSRTNLETMITRILAANPDCEIFLMTTTPADGPPVGNTSYRDSIARYYEMYRQVAKARSLTVIDLYPVWTALQGKDKRTFANYVPDTIHPGEEGCRQVVTPGILKAFGLAPEPAAAGHAPKPQTR